LIAGVQESAQAFSELVSLNFGCSTAEMLTLFGEFPSLATKLRFDNNNYSTLVVEGVDSCG